MTAGEAGKKLRALESLLRDTGSCLIAFSAGADSTFLVRVAAGVLGRKALAVTMVTPFFPASEKRDASRLASRIGIRHVFLTASLPRAVSNNPPDRCYHCKKQLFTSLLRLARRKGLNAVIEASNADDVNDYRPGMKAIEELGVRSPLREAGMTKREIRFLSKRMGLETWEKPAAACLGSRFPYGEKFTREKLAMVEKAEDYLRARGFRQVRVRCHGGLARIEVELPKQRFLLRQAAGISRNLRRLGFSYVAMDIEGYRTGTMNAMLPWKRRG